MTVELVEELESELTMELVEHRVDVARRILAALHSLAPGAVDIPAEPLDRFDYAIAHQAFVLARHAASTRDVELAHKAVRLWQERGSLRDHAVPTTIGPVLVVAAENCVSYDDDRLQDPVHLIDIDRLLAVGDEFAATLRNAVDSALSIGADMIRSCTAIVVYRDVRDLEETSTSCTFDFLPCTVALSWSAEPLRLGETLVHEATHTWLNDVFATENVTFPDGGPTFYSPWRQEERPIFGIVHAVLAFSQVIQYLRGVQAADSDDSHLALVVRQRLINELASLDVGLDASRQACEYISSERLRRYLTATVDLAHELA